MFPVQTKITLADAGLFTLLFASDSGQPDDVGKFWLGHADLAGHDSGMR